MRVSSLVLTYLCLCLSVVSAGIFSLNGQPSDMDIHIRESKNPNCRWYNSGIFSLVPVRLNSTTFCRCRKVMNYECKTYIVRTKMTTSASSIAVVSNSTTTMTTSTTATAPENTKELINTTENP